jgi:hypothetical protein
VTEEGKGLDVSMLLMSDHCEQMQCIEMVGLRFQNLQKESFGLR